ncbi:MAG: Magnesium and cobalt transport protein CorA [uncultured Chthoniobacterales bacterium]|uniref:Magnesium transport protein CorA n=1 Tax=uncultured Chthoniobacterales bacterium TaxID=1836801 RepID=A0A6J4J566_9BACT|nr:MAG: Magnesium and cobalt transport protein CorA [uncultured Chthoniobacterales bacterium]
MLTFYAPGQRGVEMGDCEECARLTREAVWIDVLSPTPEEEKVLEASLGTGIPTREEMQAIELSSRLYEENDMLFLTATVLTKSDTTHPESSAITFILTREKLVTLRYAEPAAFAAFRARREANLNRYRTSYQFMGGLIDAIIERIADILEGVGANLDQLSLRVFDRPVAGSMRASHNPLSRTPGGRARKARQRDFVEILTLIGAASDLVSRVRESLVSFVRLVTFFREVRKEESAARDTLVHSKAVLADLSSLSDHANFLAGKIGFLLDATLGMINNEQNAIIKILSVAALVFLPPTLVAGIYGMNFDVMPELRWAQGYPFAICLMIIAGVLPYLLFRRRGWL